MAASTAKKRSRSTDGSRSSFPSSVIMPSHTDKEAEYERAVAFLRKFHSRHVAALAPTSSPLGAISEVGIGDLVDDFSMALQVDSPKALKSFPKSQSSSSLSRSPRIKKTTTSTCLLDLVTTPTVSTNKTSNNKVTEEKGADDSSLYYLHQQSRDDIFSENCSSTSDFGIGYFGLNNSAGNKRHCSNLIR